VISAAKNTIYSCREYEEIAIPIQSLLGPDGQLRIFPEVANRGYFDVDYRQGGLVLKSTRYIGLIPITENISIHVQPRAPVANLIRMIERAGMAVRGLDGFLRSYELRHGVLDSPEDVYVEVFLSALEKANRIGIYKRYVAGITDKELRGRLLLSQTTSRFRSRGVRHKAVFETHDLTENNPENQIIKYTCERLFTYLIANLSSGTRKRVNRLKKLMTPFDRVNSANINPSFIARNVPRLIRSLPGRYRFYEPALWLAYLISTNSGIALERVGQARFETVILDAANIFEQYVRKVIQNASDFFENCSILDGNIRPVSLFVDNRIETKPDYYFMRDQKALAVADAKYKPAISASDRYELLAFAEALDVTNAAFIVPLFLGQNNPEHYGTTASGKVVKIVGINLAEDDMAREENRFLMQLGKSLRLC